MKRDGLTSRQQRALSALASCSTIEAAAERAGVGRSTLFRWLQEPGFQAAYRALCREVVSHASARLQQAAALAVDTLETVMRDRTAPAAARVSAARTALEAAHRSQELEDLGARLEALERHQGLRTAKGGSCG